MMTRVWFSNQKPMMTETPQTRKFFFLKKKLDLRKFFLEFFFGGGLQTRVIMGFGRPKPLRVTMKPGVPTPPLHPPKLPPDPPDVSWKPPVPSRLPPVG